MDIKKVKGLLYMVLAELERLDEKPAPVKILPINTEKHDKEMRAYNAYVKGIINREELERILKRLNKNEPPTIY